MNRSLPSRRSIRLQGYDYSSEGLYFVTICTQDMKCLFGKVIDGDMVLNDAGRKVLETYKELENKFMNVYCWEVIVMPNHFHAIIELHDNVGTDLCVCPIKNKGEHIGSPLPDIVRWFKTMTTNYYIQGVKSEGWIPFNRKLWQRNYYEHIIRNSTSYQNIADYIRSNPVNWATDNYYVNL